MAHLPRILGEDSFTQLLRTLEVQAWWYFTTDAQQQLGLICLEGAGKPEAWSNHSTEMAWRLQQEHWQKLEALGWANRLKGLIENWNLDEPPTHRHLERLAMQALQVGLETAVDILSYTHCALTLHPNFTSHPLISRRLSDVSHSGEETFAAMVESWDEDFLIELRSGDWLEKLR